MFFKPRDSKVIRSSVSCVFDRFFNFESRLQLIEKQTTDSFKDNSV